MTWIFVFHWTQGPLGVESLFCAFRAAVGIEDALAGCLGEVELGKGALRGSQGDAVGGDWAEDWNVARSGSAFPACRLMSASSFLTASDSW